MINQENTINLKKTVLLSVKPKFAQQILLGVKKIEFRRSWTRYSVENIVIYATSPVRSIVGIVLVEKIIKTSPSELWTLAKHLEGGVTEKDLIQYFSGKSYGFGILIKSVRKAQRPIDPQNIMLDFRAPQSYMFLAQTIYEAIDSCCFPCQIDK